MSIALPCGDSYLRAEVTQRPSRRTLSFEKVDPIVERELAILFAKEIDFQLKLEQLKQELHRYQAFNMRHCFKAIDYLNHKVIEESALRRFLKRAGHQPVKRELVAVMRRFDLDGDAKISFAEFVEGLTPVQPDIVQQPKRKPRESLHSMNSPMTSNQISENDMKRSMQASRLSTIDDPQNPEKWQQDNERQEFSAHSFKKSKHER